MVAIDEGSQIEGSYDRFLKQVGLKCEILAARSVSELILTEPVLRHQMEMTLQVSCST